MTETSREKVVLWFRPVVLLIPVIVFATRVASITFHDFPSRALNNHLHPCFQFCRFQPFFPRCSRVCFQFCISGRFEDSDLTANPIDVAQKRFPRKLESTIQCQLHQNDPNPARQSRPKLEDREFDVTANQKGGELVHRLK
jgi:hypothetical protein